MSSFEALTESVESSRPIEVYRFVIGSETYLYTSAEDEITVGSDIYTPAKGLGRSSVSVGQEDRGRLMEITLPQLDPFVSRYLGIAPGDNATVTIMELQRDEPGLVTQILVFTGKVRSVAFDNDDQATIGVQSQEFALTRQLPNYVYSSLCNYVLYGTECGASTVGHSLTGVTVTAVSFNTITVPGVAASGMNFVGGWCRPSAQEDFRMVIAHSGDVLTALLPYYTSPLGQPKAVFEGCDHALDGDCQAKFGRGTEFGGFHYVPEDNIFSKGL